MLSCRKISRNIYLLLAQLSCNCLLRLLFERVLRAMSTGKNKTKKLYFSYLFAAQSTSCKEQHEQNEPEKMSSHQQADDCATSPCCATTPNCAPTPSCATTPSHIADAPDEPPRLCSTLSTNQNQVSDDDPSLPMPTSDLDKQARQARGPFQPHLGSYAQTETNNRKRNFCAHWFGSAGLNTVQQKMQPFAFVVGRFRRGVVYPKHI